MGKRGSKDVSRQVILHVLFRVGIKGGMVGVRVILHLVWCDGSGQLKYHYHPPWDQLDWYTSDLLCLDSCRPPDSINHHHKTHGSSHPAGDVLVGQRPPGTPRPSVCALCNGGPLPQPSDQA